MMLRWWGVGWKGLGVIVGFGRVGRGRAPGENMIPWFVSITFATMAAGYLSTLLYESLSALNTKPENEKKRARMRDVLEEARIRKQS